MFVKTTTIISLLFGASLSLAQPADLKAPFANPPEASQGVATTTTLHTTLPDSWKARWIWQEANGPTNTWMMFRHEVDLPDKVEHAPLWIACADKYWLWINGNLVVREGGLKSGPTRDGWYVDALDVSKFLQPGPNQIAVQVWFWGNDGASHRNCGKGGFLFQLHAGKSVIASGDDWRLRVNPAFGQRGGGLSVTLAEQAVDYDARHTVADWTQPGFNDSTWETATVKGVPPAAPWGELVFRPIPLWRDSEVRQYENHEALKFPVKGPAKVVGKLSANLQVYPRFRVRGSPGAEMKIRIERDKKTTIYTTREGDQEFEVPAWGNGHHVTYEIPAGVALLDASYRETGYDADFAGSFTCSDPGLTRLWQKAARTGYLCMRDTYMDCPDRERSPWIGDAANIFEVSLRTLDPRANALIAKTFRELAGWSTPAGNLWGAVPTSRFAGAFREFPGQTLHALGFGLRSYWMHTQDEALLKEFYPAMRKYLFDLWKIEDGVVVHRGPWNLRWEAGVQCWYDWGGNVDASALDQLLYFAAIDTLGLWAEALGQNEDAARCREIQDAIRAAFDAQFWSDEIHAYRSARHKGRPDDRVQSLAVLTGLAPKERHAQLADQIEALQKSSIHFERFPLEALVRLGRPQSALQRFHKRFAFELASDYSTLPEGFGHNTNHAWGGAAVCLLAESLMGVEVIEAGCRRLRFAPRSDGLDEADYTMPTVHGALRLAFRRAEEKWHYQLSVPSSVTVEARLPIDCHSLVVNGQQWDLSKPSPLDPLRMKAPGDSIWLALGEGDWALETK